MFFSNFRIEILVIRALLCALGTKGLKDNLNGIIAVGKFSYECRVYESVDDWSLS